LFSFTLRYQFKLHTTPTISFLNMISECIGHPWRDWRPFLFVGSQPCHTTKMTPTNLPFLWYDIGICYPLLEMPNDIVLLHGQASDNYNKSTVVHVHCEESIGLRQTVEYLTFTNLFLSVSCTPYPPRLHCRVCLGFLTGSTGKCVSTDTTPATICSFFLPLSSFYFLYPSFFSLLQVYPHCTNSTWKKQTEEKKTGSKKLPELCRSSHDLTSERTGHVSKENESNGIQYIRIMTIQKERHCMCVRMIWIWLTGHLAWIRSDSNHKRHWPPVLGMFFLLPFRIQRMANTFSP